MYLTKNFNYWVKRGVPGPKPKLPGGTFQSLLNSKYLLLDEVREIYKNYKGKTPIVGVFQGVTPAVLVIDHEIVKQILITKFSHFMDQSFLSGVRIIWFFFIFKVERCKVKLIYYFLCMCDFWL